MFQLVYTFSANNNQNNNNNNNINNNNNNILYYSLNLITKVNIDSKSLQKPMPHFLRGQMRRLLLDSKIIETEIGAVYLEKTIRVEQTRKPELLVNWIWVIGK